MVRLRVAVKCAADKAVTSFQFHYGTIERQQSILNMESAFKFQFHYGTIESFALKLIKHGGILFQFHYGTIESEFHFFMIHNEA